MNKYNFIEKLDNKYLKLAEKATIKRQDITGKSKQELETVFYYGSLISMSTSATQSINIMIHVLPVIFTLIRIYMPQARPKNINVSDFMKFLYILLIFISAYEVSLNIFILSVSKNINETKHALENIFGMLAAIFYVGGDYISRVETPKSPKKGKFQKLLDKTRERLTGLLPQPITNYANLK